MRRLTAWAGLGLIGATLAVGGCETFRDRSQRVAIVSPCQAHRFEVYFAEGQADLTPAALQAISLAATALQPCEITSVRVLGLADAQGSASVNQALSEQRAARVAQALLAQGWPTPAFEIEAAGAEGAVTASGAHEPLRRRTEVLVDAKDRN